MTKDFSVADQSGKTFLITGANSGIGFETAKALAAQKAKVIMACRTLKKAEAAAAIIRNETNDADLDIVRIDLADLSSVKEAAEYINQNYDQLDSLINNAGLMMTPRETTCDGFELQFGTNVLGHFALTGQLIELIESTPHSRVVWIGSAVHWFGRIDFDNLNAEKRYSKTGAYSQSKLANLMLAYEMQRRLEQKRSNAISLAAHPGVSLSDLDRNSRFLRIMFKLGARFFGSAENGAQPSLMAATASDAGGGNYYGPAGAFTIKGDPAKQNSSKYSYDHTIASQLWRACEKLTGTCFL